MKKYRLKQTLQTKSGKEIPEGSLVEIKSIKEMPSETLVIFNNLKVVIPTIGLDHFFDGFLSIKRIAAIKKKMINFKGDISIVKSMTGQNVEPDGYDSDGFPSVLLVLGLI